MLVIVRLRLLHTTSVEIVVKINTEHKQRKINTSLKLINALTS